MPNEPDYPSDLEHLLQQMPLRRPSDGLDRRVLRGPRGRRVIGWSAAGLAAAAVLAVGVWLTREPAGPGSPTPPTARAEPVRIEQVWSAVEPRGVVLLGDNTPARGYVRHTVSRVQVIDDARNVRMEFTVPQEDYLFVPIDYD